MVISRSAPERLPAVWSVWVAGPAMMFGLLRTMVLLHG